MSIALLLTARTRAGVILALTEGPAERAGNVGHVLFPFFVLALAVAAALGVIWLVLFLVSFIPETLGLILLPGGVGLVLLGYIFASGALAIAGVVAFVAACLAGVLNELRS